MFVAVNSSVLSCCWAAAGLMSCFEVWIEKGVSCKSNWSTADKDIFGVGCGAEVLTFDQICRELNLIKEEGKTTFKCSLAFWAWLVRKISNGLPRGVRTGFVSKIEKQQRTWDSVSTEPRAVTNLIWYGKFDVLGVLQTRGWNRGFRTSGSVLSQIRQSRFWLLVKRHCAPRC
jgi:hypothetical protein